MCIPGPFYLILFGSKPLLFKELFPIDGLTTTGHTDCGMKGNTVQCQFFRGPVIVRFVGSIGFVINKATFATDFKEHLS